MSKIIIEKNVPIPLGGRGRTPIWQNLLREMEVGDSVLVTQGQAINMKKAARAIGVQCKQSAHDCPKGKVRVWRVE